MNSIPCDGRWQVWCVLIEGVLDGTVRPQARWAAFLCTMLRAVVAPLVLPNLRYQGAVRGKKFAAVLAIYQIRSIFLYSTSHSLRVLTRPLADVSAPKHTAI